MRNAGDIAALRQRPAEKFIENSTYKNLDRN